MAAARKSDSLRAAWTFGRSSPTSPSRATAITPAAWTRPPKNASGGEEDWKGGFTPSSTNSRSYDRWRRRAEVRFRPPPRSPIRSGRRGRSDGRCRPLHRGRPPDRRRRGPVRPKLPRAAWRIGRADSPLPRRTADPTTGGADARRGGFGRRREVRFAPGGVDVRTVVAVLSIAGDRRPAGGVDPPAQKCPGRRGGLEGRIHPFLDERPILRPVAPPRGGAVSAAAAKSDSLREAWTFGRLAPTTIHGRRSARRRRGSVHQKKSFRREFRGCGRRRRPLSRADGNRDPHMWNLHYRVTPVARRSRMIIHG